MYKTESQAVTELFRESPHPETIRQSPAGMYDNIIEGIKERYRPSRMSVADQAIARVRIIEIEDAQRHAREKEISDSFYLK